MDIVEEESAASAPSSSELITPNPAILNTRATEGKEGNWDTGRKSSKTRNMLKQSTGPSATYWQFLS
jgi:hypothetical protein